MTHRSRLLAPLAAMLLVSTATSAQQLPTAPMPQPVPAQVDTTRLSPLNAQIVRQEPRPDTPVAVAINWGQVSEDLQLQARQIRRTDTVTAAIQGSLPFARPTNPEAARVAETTLPVLIPATAALGLDGNARVLLYPRENFYNLSITAPGLVVEVFGTRLAHGRAPDPLTTRRLNTGDDDGYRISETEFGQELNFNRYGAAYSIAVECDRPATDPRCRTDAYVRSLATSLIIAAGNPESGGQ